MIKIQPCPKGYVTDLDKTCTPEETVTRAREALANSGKRILAQTRRIDTGRLGIPVYMSICGEDARGIMPTRKQMGKGASAPQAEASALMELAERFSYFSYWNNPGNFQSMTWSQAREAFGDRLLPISYMLQSVTDGVCEDDAARILDLLPWRFAPVTDIGGEQEFMAPLDWFKKLNEFNGSSAGNTLEESMLQGGCELVERHVCAVIDRTRQETPSIDPASFTDPVLIELHDKFSANGLKVFLKDFSLGLPVPTVAALVMDPATFPHKSEIVFTAGTASSPEKAAIRALTEIAQLGGDFETCSNYEASGLPKFTHPDQCAWLTSGAMVSIHSLPSNTNADIATELENFCARLKDQGFTFFSVDTTVKELGIPANYNFVPGFLFRERTPMASLGLFVGRVLAEDMDPEQAQAGLDVLEEIQPDAHYLPFFRGLVALRQGEIDQAASWFARAEHLQPEADDRGLAAFYQAYALSQQGQWAGTIPHLDRAVEYCPEVKEYFNLRGVAYFKQQEFAGAAANFELALALDSGSAMDLANLGLCHKFMNNADKARELLSEALALDPDLEFARTHLNEL
ncbi:ribosomal protein S12 methylthiotransferase accessory factor [Desulfomicrobium apsheronum]|uniref:Ribosomal protein S12 methylthiotransferase accessory factor n=1 Tax=Desulfomicrobium apsheronum TaxID=52560 RepID=A0A1I3ZAY7_9BACT|nr:YcaO-like family protein [Desulfomicrobium apsheronum]SFK41338.1 ribosomal protein S12 methylthiotransferase accessory factor [Desulfomicrobium apsheronum]